MNSNTIGCDKKSILINGKRVILFGGEFHYFRTPRELWEDRIRKMRDSGSNLVSTYIPWNWHEQNEGVFKWDGDQNLPEFLGLCKKYNLYVLLKPGPYICAEWDNGGFPDWIIGKNLKLRLNDEKYYSQVERWYREVARVIRPYLFTRGGNVVLFQIENEYDHLIELQHDIVITKQQGLANLMRLLKITRSAGIDIPTTTIEGMIVHGTEIINTATYYPIIPWLWFWEFETFDKKIRKILKTQPDKPIFVPELQGGWFSQYGEPLYNPPAEITNSIIRKMMTHGASLIGVFMFAGGTTFPYWGCRGDMCGGKKGEMPFGSTTSYDFGNSPIREWGQLGDKFYDLKSMAMALNAFPKLFTDTVKQAKGAVIVDHSVLVAGKNTAGTDMPAGYEEKISITQKSNNSSGFILFENTDAFDKTLSVSYRVPGSSRRRLLPREGRIKLPKMHSFIAPIEVSIPRTEIVLEHSTSELLTVKSAGKYEVVVLYGMAKGREELILRGVKNPPAKIDGKIFCEFNRKKKTLRLNYTHSGIQMARLDNLIIVLLDNEHARKTWIAPGGQVFISDAYYFAGGDMAGGSLNLRLQLKNGSKNKSIMFTAEKPARVSVDGKKASFRWNNGFSYVSFGAALEKHAPVKIRDSRIWRISSDSAEKELNFDDSSWRVINKPAYLEDIGLTGHGFFWYRGEFDKPKGLKDTSIYMDTGGIDRAYLYLNGELVRKAIGKAKENISGKLRDGRNVVAIRYENAYHTKGHPAEGPIVKRSGMAEPVVVEGLLHGKKWKHQIKHLRVRYNLGGVIRGYHKNAFDDSSWKELPRGDKYIMRRDLGDIIWLRKRFTYKKEKGWSAPLGLCVPEATERLIIYMNGKLMGKFENTGPQYKFYIPEPWLKEDNVLVMVLEGPGHHRWYAYEPKPAFIREPKFETYHEAKEVGVNLCFLSRPDKP